MRNVLKEIFKDTNGFTCDGTSKLKEKGKMSEIQVALLLLSSVS